MFSFSSSLWFNNKRVSSKNGNASIYLQVIINGRHDEFPLKFKWIADKIDRINGKLLPRFNGDPDVNDYNLLISLTLGKYAEIQRTYRLRNESLTIEKFAREIKIFDQRDSFISYMQRESKLRLDKKQIEKKTYQNAKATLALIKKFDPEALFANINNKWLKNFKSYLQAHEYKAGKRYKPGAIWSKIACTKAYLQLAKTEPMIFVNPEVHDFPNPKPNTFTTFLNKDEIRRLMILYRDQVLPEVQHRVLGGFLFTCFTSLRISDLYRVNVTWHLRQGWLYFIPKKNEKKMKELQIPIMPLAYQFIQNITGIYFNLPNQQKYNRMLKLIAVEANIPKRLTSHVGRHTFGYLYMTTMGNLQGLKEILGHSKIETTERYAHLDDDYQMDAVKSIGSEFSGILFMSPQRASNG